LRWSRVPTIVGVVGRAGAARLRLAGSWPAWGRVQVRDDGGGGQRGRGPGSPWPPGSACAVVPVTV